MVRLPSANRPLDSVGGTDGIERHKRKLVWIIVAMSGNTVVIGAPEAKDAATIL